MTAFSTLPLDPQLLKAVEVLEFTAMTPVQEHSLPALLEGKDVIGQARTGSGKTVAFGLALLSRVDVQEASVQALVLCPTRELANQVSDEIRRLAAFTPNMKVVTLCGGVPARTQTPSLLKSPQVVVGTPGRILDHLARGNFDLKALRCFVLDEADRMLDMGFSEAIEDVAKQAPEKRQTLLFSATFPKAIRKMSRSFQNKPVEVTVDTESVSGEITQVFYEVETDDKLNATHTLLDKHKPESALIFCHTKKDTREVARELKRRGFPALELHGDMEQRDRDEVLLRFANRSCTVLVATDVAARGLDVKELAMVLSYELPDRPDVHVHRIGRTGRAGSKGVALSLVSFRERSRVDRIEEEQGAPAKWERLKLEPSGERPAPAPYVTLRVNAGKKDKLRPGDLLGALTGDVGLPGDAVGKINIFAQHTFVAIRRSDAKRALDGLMSNKIKGRVFRVTRVD